MPQAFQTETRKTTIHAAQNGNGSPKLTVNASAPLNASTHVIQQFPHFLSNITAAATTEKQILADLEATISKLIHDNS